jgi:hypothetical protein
MKMVSSTDEVKPPIMARAIGAYCSAPVPSFIARGIMPMMVASDVIRIGRSRTLQAVMTASFGESPCDSRLCAKSTIRMLFESAMPISMSTPINDITFNVLCVSGKIMRTPMKPIGIASMIRNGSTKDLNCAVKIR